MTDQLLKSYTTGLSVLYVEDDPVGATIIRKMLEPFFEKVHGAADGAEGLRLFQQLQPDLVVSDLMMPVMDGIEMLREIRKSNLKLPVVLMTASLEHVHLVEAINLGVSKFLAKPLRVDALRRALLAVARELYLERVAEQAHHQEVELLQYRNRYHSSQQELARAKERHIISNLLENQYVQRAEYGGWLVDLLQQPRDIMSGDSYSVVPTQNSTLLIFLADAMGHGLSASVTSMLAAAFFNHAAAGCACCHLGFDHLATSTMKFAMRNLLEDEVFSGLVMELDPEQQLVRFASCGMPALLLVRDGQVERLRGVNPPVSAFSPPIQIQEVSLEGVSDILLATDGLGDAPMIDGGSYRELLADDLLTSVTARELFACYGKRCNDDDNDDDITLVRLTAIGTGVRRFNYTTPGTLDGIGALQSQICQQLELEGASGERLDNLELALSEALMNAFEHGCLKLGKDKQNLILEGTYDDQVRSLQSEVVKNIEVILDLVQRKERLQVWIEVIDPGAGFDAKERLTGGNSVNTPSGRGFKMMKRSVDLVRSNQIGNRLVMMQMFGE